MKIGQPVWAIVGRDGQLLGSGDAFALYSWNPDEKEIAIVKRFCEEPKARVIRAKLIELDDSGHPVVNC